MKHLSKVLNVAHDFLPLSFAYFAGIFQGRVWGKILHIFTLPVFL